MRDPKRIEAIGRKLIDHWHEVPDWRLGQLMWNIIGYVTKRTGRDIFYIEDDELMLLIDEFFNGFSEID